MPEAVNIQKKLTTQEVDVARELDAIYEFFGQGSPPTPSNSSLLLEIFAAGPLGDLLAVFYGHVGYDPAVVSVIVYLQGGAWNTLVDEVLAKPTAQEFIDYLKNAGISTDLVIFTIKSIIDVTPGVGPDETSTLRPFLDETEAVIPVDDILLVLTEKSLHSPYFQDFYTTISSKDIKALLDEVLQMPEVVDIKRKLTKQEVDVTGVLNAIYEFLGWGAPPK